MKWKVCGMRLKKNILDLAALAPDYMGFIFWEHSQRFVTKTTPSLPKSIKKTGVFVDATLDYIQEQIETHHLAAIQLHGNESPEFCSSVQSTGASVIKSFAVDPAFAFTTLAPYRAVCDFFLFDTKGPLPGGNGYRFDWSLLKAYPFEKPFFLSGGIGPEDAPTLKKILDLNLPLYAVDINSKFETEPGIKQRDTIQAFIKELPDPEHGKE